MGGGRSSGVDRRGAEIEEDPEHEEERESEGTS